MSVNALKPGVSDKQLVSGSPGWFSMVTRRGCCVETLCQLVPKSLSPFQLDASYVPRRSIMKADAACPTAESLTGPSPGSDMDGGVLLCQLVEGVSTFFAPGAGVPLFCVCEPQEAACCTCGAMVATAEYLRDKKRRKSFAGYAAG